MKCKPEVANTTGQVEDGLAGEVPLVHIERHLVLPVAGPVLELDQHILRESTANKTNTNQLPSKCRLHTCIFALAIISFRLLFYA